VFGGLEQTNLTAQSGVAGGLQEVELLMEQAARFVLIHGVRPNGHLDLCYGSST
jgi:hypothetical protein